MIKVNNFLNEKLFEEFLAYSNLTSSSGDITHPHSNVTQFNKNAINNCESLKLVSNNIEDCIRIYFDAEEVQLQKIWFVTTEFKNIDPDQLPYLPHIDYRRFLKGMIYLTNVDDQSGPIHISDQGNNERFEILRRSLPINYKEQKLNVIHDQDTISSIKPITGSQGDLILFDTNTPHFAGSVDKGKIRKIVRFDYNIVERC